MTVSELIEVLKGVPQNAIAMYYEGENGNRPIGKVILDTHYDLPVDVAILRED